MMDGPFWWLEGLFTDDRTPEQIRKDDRRHAIITFLVIIGMILFMGLVVAGIFFAGYYFGQHG